MRDIDTAISRKIVAIFGQPLDNCSRSSSFLLSSYSMYKKALKIRILANDLNNPSLLVLEMSYGTHEG